MLYTFWSTDPKHTSLCVQPWSPGLFPSHAMEKALGTRLIVCCLEVLPLSQSVGLKRKKEPKKKWRSLEQGGLVPQHNNMRSLEMTRRG